MARLLRWLLRLLCLLVGGSIVVALGSAAAAALARRRMTSTEDAESNEISVVAIFDGTRFASTAPRFRGGRVIAWFGGAMVDLRQATLDPAGASIDARAAWGGADIVVPPGWRVRMTTRALFGGGGSNVSDQGLPPDAPTLDVRGLAVYGGISVTSRPPADE